MTYSKWLKTDLHIHSHISKKTKENDYDGCDLTYEKLVQALKKEKVNLFSITDHNTINFDLYTELINRKDELIGENINFIIGSEIDFLDQEIHDKPFHMLVYFNTYDLDKIVKVITEIYQKSNLDEIDKSVQPISLNTFFKSVFDNGIQDIISIPHFNNKDKGIPPKDQIDKFVYTVFNALEDSNNRTNLIKSIKAFKNLKYLDVPIVAFSDNHNIDIYPCGKNVDKKKQIPMYILGNVEYPFNSIKSSFQDVNTRISIDNLETRSINVNHKYIKEIRIDNQSIPLSEYQNTIIGGFGTGKSFLLDMILNGKDNVDKDRYSDLANKYENFTICFSDDTFRSSLSELSNEVKLIKFDQYKAIYFKNILLDSDKNLLEKYLHIKFPELGIVEEENETQIKTSFEQLKDNCDKTIQITDIINYAAVSCRNKKAYSFKVEEMSEFFKNPDYLDRLKDNIEEEKEKKVLGKYVYSEEEKGKIALSKDIIIKKNHEYTILSDQIVKSLSKINNKIVDINEEVKQNSTKISSNIRIFQLIQEDILNYRALLKDLKEKSIEFEKKYSCKEYEKLKKAIKENTLYGYKFIAKYNVRTEYLECIRYIVKQSFRKETMFQSIIYTLDNNGTFAQSQSFGQRLDHFTSTYYKNFSTICYDIYDKDISIMKKSAGEKANIIINIIFNIIEEYSSKGISAIVILDQPEDNLDNKGIQKEVVDRIRNMKYRNSLPQLICVTHNANISITADSENIILANKINDKCFYRSSGIEDTDFTKVVCMIVEGGQDALKRRGTKFNLPIIKELERSV